MIAYDRGDLAVAETEWDYACNHITTGCSKYRDLDWVQRIRRWPPSLVNILKRFMSMRDLTPLAPN